MRMFWRTHEMLFIQCGEPAAAIAAVHFRIRTWVSHSFVDCAPAARRRKNEVYEGKLAKRKAKKFYSFPKLHGNLDRSFSQERGRRLVNI